MRRTATWLLATGLLLPGAAAAAQDGGARKDAPAPGQGLPALLERLKSPDAAVRRAAAEEAVGDPSPELTVPLARLLADEDLPVRLVAVDALGKRSDERSKRTAADALEARLLRLGERGDAGEKGLLIGALHDLAQPGSIKGLMDGIKNETPKDEVQARLRAVANVPHREAIETLINFAAACGGRRGDWHQCVRLALRYATRTDDGGGDPDLWRMWWRNHEKSFDLAWAAEERAKERAAAAERERKKNEPREKPPKRKRDGKDDGKREDPPPSEDPK